MYLKKLLHVADWSFPPIGPWAKNQAGRKRERCVCVCIQNGQVSSMINDAHVYAGVAWDLLSLSRECSVNGELSSQVCFWWEGEERWRKACISHDCVLGTGELVWRTQGWWLSRYPVGRFNKTGGGVRGPFWTRKKPCRNMGFNLMDMYVTSMGPFPRRFSAFLRSTTYGPWPISRRRQGLSLFFPSFSFSSSSS